MTEFQHQRVSGIDVYLNPTAQFKTNLIQLFVDRPLDRQNTWFALLPHVLKRGSAAYPETVELAKHLEDLYGADLQVATHKFADRHVFELQLEVANEKFLTQATPLLRQALSTLAGLLLNPATQDGYFRTDYVNQEKDALSRAIDSLFNDKGDYSAYRCIEEMCRGEAFSLSYLGSKDDLPKIDAADLTRFYELVKQEANCRLVVSGDLTMEDLIAACEGTISWPNAGQFGVSGSQVKAAGEVHQVFEEQTVSQGKLVLGLRTGVGYADSDFPALLMYNGILGAFGHSKLFMNVRERASLAYYCYSSLVPANALMLIEAGIAVEQYEQTMAIIEEQMQDMREGKWDESEYEKTLLGLCDAIKGRGDRPDRLGLRLVEKQVAGTDLPDDELLERLQAVTPEQVAAVAKKVQLDTVYFLHGEEGEEDSDE